MNHSHSQCYEFGPFRLDAQERLLQRDGVTISLTPKAFDLLLALVERHGRLVEKEELFQTVWPDTIVEESNLSSNIALIRKALGDGQNGLKLIETVPKRGYRFVAEVRQVSVSVEGSAEITATTMHDTKAPPASLTGKSKPRRKGVFLMLAALVITFGGIVWGLYKFIPQLENKGARLEPKIIPVTSLPGNESHPAFSPDGKQMAFVWGGASYDNNDIYVKLIGTETPLRLTTSPASDSSPVWSPDGRYIAFARHAAAEGSGIYLVPALGGPARRLAAAEGYVSTIDVPMRLAWHPGGEWLAVADRSSAVEPFHLSLLSVESGEQRKLTAPPTGSFGDWNPAFSPDGKLLAFTRAFNGISADVYTMPVSGGEPQRMTFDQVHLKGLAWTADSRDIVFSSSRGSSLNFATLWKIPVAGGTPERLTGVGQNAFTLAIDRQTNRLAYEQRIHDTNVYRIDTAASETSPHTKLIASSLQDDSAEYSPDGKQIAFICDRTGSLEIWLCDSDGANPRQLTNFDGPHTGTPRWSPDGQQIVFDSRFEGNQEIFLISAEGGKPHRLTADPAMDMQPSWSRDGRWVYFSSNRGGDFQIWKTPVAGGQAMQVTREGGLECFESADGQFLYYFKRIDYAKKIDRRSIWRMPVEGGEATLVLELEKTGHRRSWALTENGIYFAVAETPIRSAVEFFSFAAGRVERRVTTLERAIKQGPPGLTVSPDGRWLLYTRIDQSSSDIMLIENFR